MTLHINALMALETQKKYFEMNTRHINGITKDNTSPYILATLPPITDKGLGNINAKKRDNSARISRETRNDLSDDVNVIKMVNICQQTVPYHY